MSLIYSSRGHVEPKRRWRRHGLQYSCFTHQKECKVERQLDTSTTTPWTCGITEATKLHLSINSLQPYDIDASFPPDTRKTYTFIQTASKADLLHPADPIHPFLFPLELPANTMTRSYISASRKTNAMMHRPSTSMRHVSRAIISWSRRQTSFTIVHAR
jgi:hypothetical protein